MFQTSRQLREVSEFIDWDKLRDEYLTAVYGESKSKPVPRGGQDQHRRLSSKKDQKNYVKSKGKTDKLKQKDDWSGGSGGGGKQNNGKSSNKDKGGSKKDSYPVAYPVASPGAYPVAQPTYDDDHHKQNKNKGKDKSTPTYWAPAQSPGYYKQQKGKHSGNDGQGGGMKNNGDHHHGHGYSDDHSDGNSGDHGHGYSDDHSDGHSGDHGHGYSDDHGDDHGDDHSDGHSHGHSDDHSDDHSGDNDAPVEFVTYGAWPPAQAPVGAHGYSALQLKTFDEGGGKLILFGGHTVSSGHNSPTIEVPPPPQSGRVRTYEQNGGGDVATVDSGTTGVHSVVTRPIDFPESFDKQYPANSRGDGNPLEAGVVGGIIRHSNDEELVFPVATTSTDTTVDESPDDVLMSDGVSSVMKDGGLKFYVETPVVEENDVSNQGRQQNPDEGIDIPIYNYSRGNCPGPGDSAQAVPCAPDNLEQICSKYNDAIAPNDPPGKFSDCFNACRPAFCCIHGK